MYRTKDQVALEFIAEGRRRKIHSRGIIMAIACGLVESNLTVYANSKVPESLALPHDAVGSDGRSVGPLQQQVVWGNNAWWWGDAATCMDPTKSVGLFYDRLAKLDYINIQPPGAAVQAIQRSAYPLRYDERWAEAQAIYNRLKDSAPQEENPVPNTPSYNEFPIWSANNSARSGKPTMFLIHTQEGGGGDAAAENLAKWFQNANGVSYHYTVSQASDGGVTVVDCVDTDRAAWSVGNANSISINLCFAGSRASWTREQWMAQKNAIDVAAYLAVQDAKKYGFAPMVVPPPYTNGRPGISDHRWVTDVFKWGTHTDVGAGFPWDYFTERVNHWANGGDTPAPEPPKAKRFPEDWTDRELLIEILRQLRGYNLDGWPQLGGKSLVDAVAELRSTP
ncbi:lysin A [Mycobacterium phage Frankie]|nr:lysin A [Mycobacterium phage Frankie]